MAIPLIVSTLARAAGTYLAKKGANKAVKGLAKRKPLKKQSTPKDPMNKVIKQKDRQVAKDYKKETGESIKKLTPKRYQTQGSKQFKYDYKKPKDSFGRGLTPGMEVLIKNNLLKK